MPTTLALCFDAPMQSWGTLSRFTYRDTATEPTKSGVVGLLGAALGVARDDNEGIAALAALRLGVRVDRPGTVERDYHTVQNVPTTTGRGHRGQVTERFYLADATFLVVLEGDPELLANIAVAVHRPRWPLHFGRKAFPPARPLLAPPTAKRSELPLTGAGLQPTSSLENVLTTHTWLEFSSEYRQRANFDLASGRERTLRTVVDSEPGHSHAELRHDHPVTFTRDDRRHTAREVIVGHVQMVPAMLTSQETTCS